MSHLTCGSDSNEVQMSHLTCGSDSNAAHWGAGALVSRWKGVLLLSCESSSDHNESAGCQT
jgi:hypothetical protein